jgi:IS5 family transposase
MFTRLICPGVITRIFTPVSMVYRGHGCAGAETIHVDRRRRGNLARARWKRMKRRAAVEPTIGHCKNEHRLERNRLRGAFGDALNALLSAAAMNFQKRLAAFCHFILRLMLGLKLQPALPC